MSVENTIVLFTASYPYDIAAEKTFLENEVEYLSLSFDRVIIVPETIRGGRYSLSPGVEVEESFARIKTNLKTKIRTLFRALFSRLFYEELFYRPSILLSLRAIEWLIVFTEQAGYTRRWVCDLIKRKKLVKSRCVFYTYWFDQCSLGIGMARKKYPWIKLVSRAHGSDIYEKRHEPAYIPCRRQSLRLLDALYPDSEKGRDYIVSQYHWMESLCKTMRLGVSDPGFTTKYSKDGIIRIVSCSSIVPVKRVDLIMEGIGSAARLRNGQQFEWHHFGEGQMKSYMKDKANKILPSNVRAYFPGYESIEKLMLFYRENPVDLFINASESEGTSVAVMEAASCGIALLATAVGGNPEIVTEKNGKLLSANPTPDEIAHAIFDVMEDQYLFVRKRAESKKVWERKYKAEVNLQVFMDELRTLVSSAY